MNLYSVISFSHEDGGWQHALRFYRAARYRNWAVRKEKWQVWITFEPPEAIRALADDLGIPTSMYEVR